MQRCIEDRSGKNPPATDDGLFVLDIDGGIFGAVSGVNKKDAVRT